MRSIFFFFGVVFGGLLFAALGADENAREFNEMCRIYRILIRAPEGIEIQRGADKLDPSAEAQSILDEIGLFRLSTSPQVLYNSVKTKSKKDEGGEVKGNEEISNEQWAAWHEKLKLSVTAENQEKRGFPKVPPPDSEKKEEAFRLISRLQKRAQSIKAKVDSIEATAKNDLAQARKHMISAVYGVTAVEAKWKTHNATYTWNEYVPGKDSFAGQSSDAYTKGCQASGADVGKSLANDMCCICGPKTSTGAHCASDLSFTSEAYNTGPDDGVARWKRIKQKCENTPGVADEANWNPSPEALLALIAHHRSLLGSNVVPHTSAPTSASHVTRKNYILGRAAASASSSGFVCEGTSAIGANQGVCVDYSAILSKGQEIPWVAEVRKAAVKLEAARKKEQQLQALISQLETSELTAQNIYEAALIVSPSLGSPEASPSAGQTKNTSSKSTQPAVTAGRTAEKTEPTAISCALSLLSPLLLFQTF